MAYTTIDDPSAYFQATTYTGNGANTVVTNGGNSDLKPDFLWIKNRTAGYAHFVVDSNRNISYAQNSSNAPYLETDSTAVENNNQNWMQSVNTDGFTTGIAEHTNCNSGSAYVAWQWKANGGTTTAFSESGNNPGGTHQANTTAGFSIVTYTGTGGAGTVSHGLSATPRVIMVKRTSGVADWNVYHASNTSAPETDFLVLNTEAATSDNTRWNDTAPTTSVFSVGTDDAVNGDASTYLAFVFAEKQGYSKFGSYVGNGNANGPFVYTGFKPAFVMCKNATTAGDNWEIRDNKRNDFNPQGKALYPNLTAAEYNATAIATDSLSNGFKVRATDHGLNESGQTYIYMAFAENPFVTSTGIPTTAR